MTKEMQSNLSETAADNGGSDLDPKALAAIRNLLDTQPDVPAEPVAERHVEQAVRPKAAQIDPPPVAPRRAAVAPEDGSKAKPRKAKPAAKSGGLSGRVNSSIFGFRPSLKFAIWTSFALLVFLRPWLVIGLSFIGLIIMIGVFLIVGYDGFWRGAMGMARWYARRRPNRAAEMHRKLDSFAMKWDAVLDRFPEGTVDGLYLPDFGNLATADARHDAALDRRFANMAEREV
jgi:hypothetical protein